MQPKNDNTPLPPLVVTVPELALDHRLSLIQLRVLLALFSFRNKSTGLVFPTRETLGRRCGYSPQTISRATSELVTLGWLVKTGNGGRSKATQYRITVPELETVSEPETVSTPDTQTVSGSDTKTVSGSERGIEQTIEQTSEQGEQRAPELDLDGGQVEAELYLIDKSGNPVAFTVSDLDAYQRAYPAIDVRANVVRMDAWLRSNPTRRPTSNGMARFVNGWLNREHDRSHFNPNRRGGGAQQRENRNADVLAQWAEGGAA